ncbi:MAG: hypothetical protein MMC23_005736 [Stictis urceolatum]|nr:hypothetical protein [Stictis urceolata]
MLAGTNAPPRERSQVSFKSSHEDKPIGDGKRGSVSTGDEQTLNNSSSYSKDHSRADSRTNSRTELSPVEDDSRSLLKSIDRGAPGDAALIAMVKRNPDEIKHQKRKSQFYSEVFAYREPLASPRERAGKDSVVTAKVKTNVIVRLPFSPPQANPIITSTQINDEYTFMTDLSSFLSARYSRPASSIMITLDHSACLLFGGSFDPAYHLTILALPGQVQSTVNKRNAALLQNFFEEELSVPPPRGVVRFEAVPEECLATQGVTVLAEIEAMKRSTQAPGVENGEVEKKNRKRLSVMPGPMSRANLAETLESPVKSLVRGKGPSLVPPSVSSRSSRSNLNLPSVPKEEITLPNDVRALKVKKMGKRRSLMQMFGR